MESSELKNVSVHLTGRGVYIRAEIPEPMAGYIRSGMDLSYSIEAKRETDGV